LCLLLFAICFVVLGAAILLPDQLVPSGRELLSHQAKFLTDFHPYLLYFYQVGIFMAFWGTIYGAYEIYSRTAYECIAPLSRGLRALPAQRVRIAVLLYCGIGGIILLWSVKEPLDLVKPASLIGGVFTCGLWCFAMIWVDRRFLPKPLRMRSLLLVLTAGSGVFLTVAGTIGIWKYVMSFFGD